MSPSLRAGVLSALLAGASCAAARALRRRGVGPLTPSSAQAKWQTDEIMALTHFNMATFFHNGDPGCDASNWLGCDPAGGCNSSDPASFAPSALNVSNWAESMLALGVTEAVLTAKHGCGFYLWPTNVTLPGGAVYPYRVDAAKYGDVLAQFSDTMAAHGLGHGFYYSLTNNFFLNEASFRVRDPSTLLPRQTNVTQDEFEAIVVASVTELWSSYGELTEIWFDGGYQSTLQANITALLASLQPRALALNGEGISPSPGRWSGTEGSVPPGWPNIYSTTCCNLSAPDPAHTCEGAGCAPDDASGLAFYNPSSTDFTLQANVVWFFEPAAPLRSLDEMIAAYHATVGANTVLELDFAVDRTGRIAPDHAALYARFGAWRRACYGGAPLAAAELLPGASSVELPLPGGAGARAMDRVVLQEAVQAGVYGQCVANYSLEVRLAARGGGWAPFGASGAHLIGAKRIELNAASAGAVGAPLNATAVRFNVSREWCASHVRVAVFGPDACAPPPPPATRVRFVYADGRCLVTNATFPCGGGAGNSCPLFLGDCAAPQAAWDDGDAASLVNLAFATPAAPNVVNADCDSCAPGALFKLITGSGSAARIAFDAAAGGLLRYACAGGGGPPLCLNGGQGKHTPSCGGEPWLATQIVAAPCAGADAGGWRREALPPPPRAQETRTPGI